jgi:hypothetical protein
MFLRFNFLGKDVLPETLVNHQTHRRGPEYELVLAILEDAVGCFQQALTNEKRIRQSREAKTWFMKTGDGQLFTFDSVCRMLEIDPSYVRQGLIQWECQYRTSIITEGLPQKLKRRRI